MTDQPEYEAADPAPDDPTEDPAQQPPSTLPRESSDDPDADALIPTVTNQVDPGQIKHFITEIKSAEQQVGEHIIEALQDAATVAVLTTVIVAPDGGQRIVSAALDPELMGEVQTLLTRAQHDRQEEVPCVGFHCLLKRRERPEQGDADATS